MIADGFDEAYGLTPGIQIGLKEPGIWYLLGLGQNAAGDTTYGLWRLSFGAPMSKVR